MAGWVLGVIGGSGLYAIEGLANARFDARGEPFRRAIRRAADRRAGGVRLAFLPRHGRGHPLPPSAINGPRQHRRPETRRLHRRSSRSARPARCAKPWRRGRSVLVDQIIDRTFAREDQLLRPGPGGPRLDGRSGLPAAVAAGLPRPRGRPARRSPSGGTYLAMEGPQFSSRAESQLYRSWGCDVNRYDRHARGQARPRGRAALRLRGDDHRLRTVGATRTSRSRTCWRCWRHAEKARDLIRHLAASPPAERPPSPIGYLPRRRDHRRPRRPRSGDDRAPLRHRRPRARPSQPAPT